MNNKAWLERLQTLCARFLHLGLGGDIAALSLIEAWGLYLFLMRLAEEQGIKQ